MSLASAACPARSPYVRGGVNPQTVKAAVPRRKGGRPRLESQPERIEDIFAVAHAYLFAHVSIEDLAERFGRKPRTIQLWVNRALHMPGAAGDRLRWLVSQDRPN